MDKKSASGVEPSSAAIKAAEEDFDTKEKQKDLIAHVQSEEEEESWSDVEDIVVDDEPTETVRLTTLYARNLSLQVERSDIEEFFKEAGQVVDVRFGMSQDGERRFLGLGIVEFATANEAEKAFEFHGRPLLGSPIRLEFVCLTGLRPTYSPQCSSGVMEHGISSLTL